MTYSRRNIAAEQQEASLKAKQLITLCEQLHITLDPIDWQEYGMRAPIKVNGIEISDLTDLGQRDSDYILRRIQLKLFERVALSSVKAKPGQSASMWSPVDVQQPQAFLSLWVITLDTGERIPVIESLKNGQRVYEPYQHQGNKQEDLAKLFGPLCEGEYQVGETITIEERDHQGSGEIVYIIPPGKKLTSRTNSSRGYHTIAGKAYTNDAASRYVVDCHDGFPHIVNQSQITK